jgi:peptide chain release factor 2
MRRLAEKTQVVQRWRGLEKKLADIAELIELSDEEDPLQAEIEKELEEIAAQLDELEFQLAFSGEYDTRNAILAIHAGAGGTESQDWAEMLMRMYLRWGNAAALRRRYWIHRRGMRRGSRARSSR